MGVFQYIPIPSLPSTPTEYILPFTNDSDVFATTDKLTLAHDGSEPIVSLC